MPKQKGQKMIKFADYITNKLANKPISAGEQDIRKLKQPPRITNQNVIFRLIVFIVIFVAANTPVKAQYNFEYLTSDKGLSDNMVHAIFRDKKDYLWIGTTNHGLNKFDGHNVTVIQKAYNQPGSLSSNAIRCIYQDSKNKLWIGTTDGLNLYNYQTNTFQVFRHNLNDTLGNYITSIYEDTKGNLWITYILGAGLCKFDPADNSFKNYRITSGGNLYRLNSMTSIREDSKGNLWVVSKGNGLFRFDPHNGGFIDYNVPAIDLGQNIIKRIYITPDDIIWIGTFGNGLFAYNPQTKKFKQYKNESGNKGLNNELITDIIQTDNSHLWIATDQGGINILDLENNTFKYIIHDQKKKRSLNNNGILSLYKDYEGIIWAGTSRGGLNYYNPNNNRFKLFEHSELNSKSLSYNIVGCFYEDSEGLIWVGTDGGGLNVYDPKTGHFSVFRHNPKDPNSISGDVIRCISEDKDNNLWIGTWDAGLNKYDRKTGRFYHYLPNPNDPKSISSKTVWHMTKDHKNNLWLCNYHPDGVEIFDPSTGIVTKRFSTNKEDPTSLIDDEVRFVYKDHENNIWLCTAMGINLYDSINNSFKVFNNFPENNIRAFCRDQTGNLWAGSVNNGLFLFTMDDTVIKVYDKTNGLPNNTIQSIVEDNNGNLWISTNNGISKFNPSTQRFTNYHKIDGLQGNTFFQQSFLKSKSGEIYFGGYNGFNSFLPDNIKVNDYIPKVYLTDFKIFNKPVKPGEPGSPLKNHISETRNIRLSWHESVISFEFSAVIYTHYEKCEYAYIMDGFEEDWNFVGNKTDATYTNLNPGKYIFRVKASNNDGVWGQEATSLNITIIPPWWKTIWTKLAIILIGTIIIIAFINYRTLKLKLQKKHLSNMVKKRTQQLEEANANLKANQEEISAKNEELESQKENLLQANNILEEQSKEIETQNIELSRHRNHLEQLIKERTSDLVAALKKAEESDKLKSAFLANMSHEIRTPMNAIVGFSTLLDSPDISKEERSLFTTDIKKSCDSLLVIIDDILEMSKIKSNQLTITEQAVNIVEIINESINLFSMQAQAKGLDLIFDDKNIKKELICNTDKQRLKQVLSSLIGNAMKFTDKGQIEVSLLLKKPGYLTFVIKDTGIGISKEAGDSIFQQFYKVESEATKHYAGIGLGLTICSSIVNSMGGEIWYESEIGEGTTFYFTIPLKEPKTIDKLDSKTTTTAEIPDLSNMKVLIVEDDEPNYMVISLFISKTNAETLWAQNGLKGLEMFKAHNNIDLILMDLRMPVMNGIEASKQIWQIKPDQKIVAQTAFTDMNEEAIEEIKSKFYGYLKKPIMFNELMRLLQKLVS